MHVVSSIATRIFLRRKHINIQHCPWPVRTSSLTFQFVKEHWAVMVIIASGLEEVENVPETLEEFFQAYPRIGEANQALTAIPHVNTCEFRDQVLFIKQRQQATSDYRENPHVQWIGSHAAMTCHIVIMRHRITGVTSLGHFDNFCCWQLGEDSSAHRDGLDIMVEEISYLSNGNFDNIEVMIMQNILRTILEILNFFK